MKTIMIGDYIKRRRVELGMTQGQLAKGICTVATLSRLEAGIQTPRRNRISALLQRLGLPDSRYFAINTQEEVAIEAYKKDIVACNVLERVEEGFEKLQKLEQLLSPDESVCGAVPGAAGRAGWPLHPWAADGDAVGCYADDHPGFFAGRSGGALLYL